MGEPKYNFQYCQKLVLFSRGWDKVFLARRKGEADYDQTYSFICGKLETGDKSILAGLKREKDEEVGADFKVKVYPHATKNILYTKKSGDLMILPHYIAQHVGGDVNLNLDEYCDYVWIALENLAELEPKVETIPDCVDWALSLRQALKGDDFVEL